jgi:hypothetical protein
MSPFTSLLLRILVATALTACGGVYTSDSSQAFPQGISGTITKSVGDFQCCPITGKTYPLSVPVHVVRGKVPLISYQAPPHLADLDVVVTVQSDSDGRFGVGLPPGIYTAFVEIDGALFLNCSEGADPTTYCWYAVESGKFVEIEINDNSQSTA